MNWSELTVTLSEEGESNSKSKSSCSSWERKTKTWFYSFQLFAPPNFARQIPPQALTQTDMFVLVGCKVLHYGERAECKRSDFNSTLSPPNLLPQTSHLQLRKINDTVNALVLNPKVYDVHCACIKCKRDFRIFFWL